MEDGAGLLLMMLRFVGAAPYKNNSFPGRVSSERVIWGRITNTLISVIVLIGGIYFLDYNLGCNTLIYALTFSGRACLVFIMLKATYSGPERVTRLARFLDTLREIEGKFTPKLSDDIYTVGFILLYLVIYNITVLYNHFTTGEYAIICLLLSTIFSIANIVIAHIIMFARRIKNSLKKMNDDLQRLTFEESIKSKEEKQQDRVIIHKIRIFSKQYESICNMVRTNTREDGQLLAATMAFTMIELNINSFNIVLTGAETKYLENSFLVELTMWSLHLLHLVFAVEPFHETHTELQRTTCLASELQSNVDENEQTSCELLLFVYRLALDKPRYRPLELFTIDRPLALKIFGTITTYCVIMLTYV